MDFSINWDWHILFYLFLFFYRKTVFFYILLELFYFLKIDPPRYKSKYILVCAVHYVRILSTGDLYFIFFFFRLFRMFFFCQSNIIFVKTNSEIFSYCLSRPDNGYFN